MVAVFAATLFLIAPSRALPSVLIVPGWTPGKDGPTTSPSLANYLAQEFQEDGRLAPIVWGSTDPIFRAAALDGKLGNVPEFAKPEEVPAVAKALKADYVLYYTSKREGEKLKVKGQLFEGGRPIWLHDDLVGALNSKGGFDKENTAATIAHTWLILLFKTPLKQYSLQKAAVPTPEAQPGQAPKNVGQVVAPAGPNTNVQLFQEFKSLVKDGKAAAAEAYIRDAIDAVPLDPKRRSALISFLVDKQDYSSAAQESLLASRILPDSVDLQLLAIRTHLLAGQPKAALEVANEFAARDGKGLDSRLALAEVHLYMEEPARTVEDLEKINKETAPAAMFLLRAAARANLGGSDGCELDLAQFAKRSTSTDDRLYLSSVGAVDLAFVSALRQVQTAFQRVLTKQSPSETAELLEGLSRTAQSRATFFQKLAGPEKFKASHESAALATNLLRLCLLDLAAAAKGNEEAMTDARINFAEAVKQMSQAREQRSKELSKSRDLGVAQA